MKRLLFASMCACLLAALVGCGALEPEVWKGFFSGIGTTTGDAVKEGLSGFEQGGIIMGVAGFLGTYFKSFARIYTDFQAKKKAVAVPA